MIALAALAGAAGVAEAAYAAHGLPDPRLQTSSQFLVVHAAAVIAITAAAQAYLTKPRPMLLGGALLLFGTILFGGDLTMLAMTGARLFPMAAPLGGSLMIAGWIGTALAALLCKRRIEL